MARLLTLRRALARLLTPDEVDDNIVNVATDFQGAVDPATLAGANVLPFMRWADTGTGWVRRRNVANDDWVNEQRLHRASLAVFGADQVPAEDVGPICIAGKGYAEWDDVGGGYRMLSGSTVGTPDYWPLRSSIPAGQIPQDGQTVPRATYPDLAAMVISGTLPVVSEETWQSDPTHRGKYTLGDGNTTIRLPDLNGKSSGTLGAVVLRGDGSLSAGVSGAIQRDAFQGHHHGTVRLVSGAGAGSLALVSNAGTFQGSDIVGDPSTDGTNGTPRTAAETRALNVTGVWTVHAFGSVVNPGSVDAAQLASDLADVSSRVSTIEATPRAVFQRGPGSGEWITTVPTFFIDAVAGGGGGGGAAGFSSETQRYNGAGGGAGESMLGEPLSAPVGSVLSWTVGSGGQAGPGNVPGQQGYDGAAGTNTVIRLNGTVIRTLAAGGGGKGGAAGGPAVGGAGFPTGGDGFCGLVPAQSSWIQSGGGASSPFGGGGPAVCNLGGPRHGGSGGGYGSGGGGGASPTIPAQSGGNGGPGRGGFLKIWW